jgi:hypothetical protein
MLLQMDTGMLRSFKSSKTHLGLHGPIKTRRIVAANPALFQQFNATNFLANSLPFVQLDRFSVFELKMYYIGRKR